jgi:predicted secreted protein
MPPDVWTLRGEVAPLAQGECPTDDVAGLHLELAGEGGAPARPVHHDGAAPALAPCASGYRIAGVVLHRAAGEGTTARTLLALIAVYVPGFEGRDVEWAVVGAELDTPGGAAPAGTGATK